MKKQYLKLFLPAYKFVKLIKVNLKGSSLIETVVASTIILITFQICSLLIANLISSPSTSLQIIASLRVQEITIDYISNQSFQPKQIKFEDMTITISIEPTTVQSVINIKSQAIANNGAILFTKNELCQAK